MYKQKSWSNIYIENVLNKKEIIIQGDGKEKLDFTYIDDLVNGIICAIKSKTVKPNFNLTYVAKDNLLINLFIF